MNTIHEKAKKNLSTYTHRWTDWRESHPTCPEWIAGRIVASLRRGSIRRAAREAIYPQWPDHCTRDTVTRRAEYRGELGAICAGVRRVTGLSGHALRSVALAVRARRYSWGPDMSAMDTVPNSAMGGIAGGIRATGIYHEIVDGLEPYAWTAIWAASGADSSPERGIQHLLLMAITDAVRLDIGEPEALQTLARIRAGGHITGYMADDVAGWISYGGDSARDYERCSGGEQYTWLRRRPQYWAELIAAAPAGKSTETAIQCFPHEKAKADACAAVGLSCTFRLSDSIYSGPAEKIAEVLAQLTHA